MSRPNRSPASHRSESNTAWFLVGNFAGDREQRHYPIRVFPYVIGRRTDVSLCLPFQTVSGVHAEIDVSEEGIFLRDLHSTNGTFVNGRRISETTYLTQGDLIQLADVALRIQRQDSTQNTQTLEEDVCDQALALVQFDKLMTERLVTPNYQPIISLASTETLAYEVVGRSALFGVETPRAMFRAAEKLNLEVPLSSMLRWEGVVRSLQFHTPPHLFVNTHPRELAQPGLIESLHELRKVTPDQKITLEIHENAVSGASVLRNLKSALRELAITLAYDDFGVGQARLNEMADACPDYLKFDISLIRDLDSASEKRLQMVERLVHLGKEMGAVTVAEGVETQGEANVCCQLGFELGQGFLFGRPAPVHHAMAR